MREMITSTKNKKIRNYLRLLKKKYRNEMNMYIIEGYHLVEEALKTNLVLEVITSNEKSKGTLVAPHVLEKFTDTKTPQSIIAIIKKPIPRQINGKSLVLDCVQDPGNVGTLIRTAKSFGFNNVIIKGADPFGPKALRSSQGAHFFINLIYTQNITQYFVNQQVVGAILDKDAKTYTVLKPKANLMLVLGNEGGGISEEVYPFLEEKIYIPIKFNSLNVTAAAAILLNEYK